MSSVAGKVARGTLFLSVASALSRLIAFFTVILVTRGLSLYDYGVVTLLVSVTGPINSISGLGLDELMLTTVSESLGAGRLAYAKKLLRSFFAVRFLIIAGLCLIGWFFRGALEARYGAAISTYFFLVMILAFVQFARNAFTMIFQIHQQFGALSLFSSSEGFVRLLTVIACWYYGVLNVETILLSYVIAAALPLVAALPTLFKTLARYRGTPTFAGGVLWPILVRHGKWQMALDIATSFISNVRYWLIHLLLSTEAVALYSVAQSMFSAVASLLPMKSVMTPMIAERSNDRPLMTQLVQRSTKYALLAYVVLMAVSMGIAPFFISMFFPKYVAAIFIFQLMSLRLPFNAFSISQAPLFIILKEQRHLFVLAFVNGLSVLILSPILITLWGLPGSVLEWLVTAALIMLLREHYLRRHYGIASLTWKSLIRVDAYDKLILQAIARKIGLRWPAVPPG